MADILSAIVGFVDASTQIDKYVITPVKNRYNYIFHYHFIIHGLRAQAQELNSTRDHLQQQIEEAQKNLQVILPHVLLWCRKVDELQKSTERIFNFSDQPREGQNYGACLLETCPKNLKVRYSLAKEAMKLTSDVVRLQKEFIEFGSHIGDPLPLMAMQTIPSASDTLEFKSRKRNEEEIMAWLRDESIRMIGVCGMGGVGKTTMANKIKEMAIEETLFHDSVTVVVSQQLDVWKIQQQLAEGLGLNLTEETVLVRARRIHTRLKEKRVLIILDDVWGRLNLEELGIPVQSKIIITSRDHGVCSMMSATIKILTLEVLCEGEAFSLFCENAGVGINVGQNSLHPLAIELTKECKGLPLALKTVACALRGKTQDFTWRASLQLLKESAPANIPGYLKDVYQPLELSYRYLESDQQKYLFLLCCLFPEDSLIEIEDLVCYSIGLSLISSISISDARDKVCYLVNILIERCLLTDAGFRRGCRYVKMHDVIRDMAIHILFSSKHVFLVSHDKGLRELPEKEADEDYTCISVTLGTDITISESRNFPRLVALSITFDSLSTASKLPICFFNRMAGLKILRLNKVSRLSLLSLESLTHLRVLRLDRCNLSEKLSSIGQLVNLEVLICHESDICELPNEVGGLTKLKLLDLNYCLNLRNIPQGVVSGLVQMEELRLFNCPIEWGYEGHGDDQRSNASIAEVFSLRNLRALQIWIINLEVIPQVITENSLTSYSISIGPGDSYPTYLKNVRIDLDKRKVFTGEVSKLCEVAEELHLRGHGTKDIIDQLKRQGFKNVKELRMRRVGTVKHLANGESSQIMFPVLRLLQLSSMDDLEEICHGPPGVGSFRELQYMSLYELDKLMYMWKIPCDKVCLSNLKTMKIEWCRNLKWLLPLSVVESLSSLESIKIWNCQNMEKIFEDDGESRSGISNARGPIKFPNLKELVLYELPKLCALCKADHVFEFPSIECLEIVKVSPSFKL